MTRTARLRWRRPGRPVRRVTEISKKLREARVTARLLLRHIAAAAGVTIKTAARWELGDAKPNRRHWPKLIAYYAQFVPNHAVELARLAGLPSPFQPPPVVDLRGIEDALARAADILDVSPRRVRAAVREILKAVSDAHGSLDDLARAAEDKSPLQLEGARTA
jgi:transcriptional regulator with XRE-family HTH domain